MMINVIMDSGLSVAAGTRARCTKLPGACVSLEAETEEGGGEVHGCRRTWATRGSALPALWQHPPLPITPHTPAQLPTARRHTRTLWQLEATLTVFTAGWKCQGMDASQEQWSTCDGWELVNDYPSSSPRVSSLWGADPTVPQESWQLKLMAYSVSFLSCLTSPLIPTSGSPLKSTWALKSSLSQGLLLVEPKLRCWQSAG